MPSAERRLAAWLVCLALTTAIAAQNVDIPAPAIPANQQWSVHLQAEDFMQSRLGQALMDPAQPQNQPILSLTRELAKQNRLQEGIQLISLTFSGRSADPNDALCLATVRSTAARLTTVLKQQNGYRTFRHQQWRIHRWTVPQQRNSVHFNQRKYAIFAKGPTPGTFRVAVANTREQVIAAANTLAQNTTRTTQPRQQQPLLIVLTNDWAKLYPNHRSALLAQAREIRFNLYIAPDQANDTGQTQQVTAELNIHFTTPDNAANSRNILVGMIALMRQNLARPDSEPQSRQIGMAVLDQLQIQQEQTRLQIRLQCPVDLAAELTRWLAQQWSARQQPEKQDKSEPEPSPKQPR